MKRKTDKNAPADDDLLPEYDFAGGVRGKHAQAYQQGYTVTTTNPDGSQTVQRFEPDATVVMLDPDVRRYFPTAEIVNRTLRTLIGLIPTAAGTER